MKAGLKKIYEVSKGRYIFDKTKYKLLAVINDKTIPEGWKMDVGRSIQIFMKAGLKKIYEVYNGRYIFHNTKDKLLAGMNDKSIPKGWQMDVGSLR